MVYLSPPRFYFEINLNFNITCIISTQNFTEAFCPVLSGNYSMLFNDNFSKMTLKRQIEIITLFFYRNFCKRWHAFHQTIKILKKWLKHHFFSKKNYILLFFCHPIYYQYFNFVVWLSVLWVCPLNQYSKVSLVGRLLKILKVLSHEKYFTVV